MLTPQDLIEMRKIFAAAALIQAGAFKVELDSIEKAGKACDAKLGVIKTLEEVEKMKAKVEADFDKAEEGLKAREAALVEGGETQKKLRADLAKMQESLNAKEATLGGRESSLVSAENVHKRSVMELEEREFNLRRQIDDRQQRLVDRENLLVQAEKDLAERIRRASQLIKA